MKNLFSFFSIILFLSANMPAQDVGDVAPGFSYNYLGGSPGDRISLSDFSGKVVYIFFYGAACPHCVSNGPVTETEIHQSFKDEPNFVALGLDTWNLSTASNATFRNRTGITYNLLLNAQQTLVDYYGHAGAYDRSVVIGPEGIIRYKGNNFVNTDFAAVKAEIETQINRVITSSEDSPEIVTSVRLDQNYPNPFNPSTTISYSLINSGSVKLQIYNILGKKIITLVDGFQSSGVQTAIWDASSVPSGVYIYRLTAGDQVLYRRMMLIK